MAYARKQEAGIQSFFHSSAFGKVRLIFILVIDFELSLHTVVPQASKI